MRYLIIMMLLVGCSSLKKKPQYKSIVDRRIDCLTHFQQLGLKSDEAINNCKFSFEVN